MDSITNNIFFALSSNPLGSVQINLSRQVQLCILEETRVEKGLLLCYLVERRRRLKKLPFFFY
jgi:hypothetical protein